MPDDIIASVPLGWILAAALLVGLFGFIAGWLVFSWRARRGSATVLPATAASVPVFQNGASAEFTQRLTRNLAHELRTPLTAILGHVEILNSCDIGEEQLWRRSLGFVGSETERLSRLVEDLLYLSRLERLPLDLHPANLRQLAEQALAMLSELAAENQVGLELHADEGLPEVEVDADRIRQVFINLVENAIKYAPGCHVSIHLAAGQDRLAVQVHDDGPGIAAGDLPRICEPFYRSQGVRQPGSGLGLAIVRAILDQHNAPLQATSLPGEGTSFQFTLPIYHPSESV